VTDAELLAAAVEARRGTYSPYSNFAVGAALLGTDGRLWTGANVENASYGLASCAERNAVFHAVNSGARTFSAVAIAGPDGVATMPCGACRQVLYEFAPALRIIVAGEQGTSAHTIGELLPGAFGPGDLPAKPAP
jgi:cytidine deaminase